MLEQNFLKKTEELTEFKDGANFRISGICNEHDPEWFPNEDLLSECLDLYTERAEHQKLIELISFFDDNKLIYTDDVLTKLKEINKLDPQMYYDIMKVVAFMLKVKDVNAEVDFSKRISDYLFEGTIAFLRNSGFPITEEGEEDGSNDESIPAPSEETEEVMEADTTPVETVEENTATEETKVTPKKKTTSKKDAE